MEILNALSADDKSLIEKYIVNYAGGNSDEVWGAEPSVDMDTLLLPWAEAKSESLWDMMGHTMTLSREISYSLSDDELVDQFNIEWNEDENAITQFLNALFNECIEVLAERIGANYFDTRQKIKRLCFNEFLATNKFDTIDPMTIGKISVPVGCKPVRILGKIVKEYLPELSEMFEEFRLEHSRLLNQRSLKGTLCLSIHPLDYMTMSDNECDWDSCMSWQQRGDYRQGTVEMMNSPCVVIAYMHNPDKPMRIPGGKWNNKKWRCLFVVNSDTITEIRSYPYQNEYISETVLNWLRELAEANLHWEYNNDKPYVYLDPDKEDPNHTFQFITDKMYSDFRFKHIMYVGKTAKRKNYIKYSGVSECMCCGDHPLDYNLEASELLCPGCNGMVQCENCHNWVYSDDTYSIDGMDICSCCYEEETYRCPICNEYHVIDDDLNNRTIYLIHQDALYSYRLEFCPEHYKQFLNGEINYGPSMIYQCTPIESHKIWWRTSTNLGMELTELNKEGLEAFDIRSDMISHFKDSIARYRFEFDISDKILWHELKNVEPTEQQIDFFKKKLYNIYIKDKRNIPQELNF